MLTIDLTMIEDSLRLFTKCKAYPVNSECPRRGFAWVQSLQFNRFSKHIHNVNNILLIQLILIIQPYWQNITCFISTFENYLDFSQTNLMISMICTIIMQNLLQKFMQKVFTAKNQILETINVLMITEANNIRQIS